MVYKTFPNPSPRVRVLFLIGIGRLYCSIHQHAPTYCELKVYNADLIWFLMGKEIDKLIDSLKGKNARERDKEMDSSMDKDMSSLSRILSEMKEKNETMKRDIPGISELVDKLKLFYKDLESDGLIKIERELFMISTKESIKESGEREKGTASLTEVRKLKLTHQQAFNKLNDFYHGAYCFFLKYALKRVAEKLAGRELRLEGDIVQELKKYKGGKYKEIFDCVKPQIKNSISHKKSLIDQKYPKIAFIDEKKPNLNLTLEKFKEICYKLFYLQLAHDILQFELIEDVSFDIARKLEVVNEFMKKYGGKIVNKNGELPSIDLYEFGKFLESDKDKWK